MRKSPRNSKKTPFILLPIPVENAFERVSVDVLGPFPPSEKGNRYLIIFFAIVQLVGVRPFRFLVQKLVLLLAF